MHQQRRCSVGGLHLRPQWSHPHQARPLPRLQHSPRAVRSRGRDRKEEAGIRLPEAEKAEFELLSDLQQPSRIGTSITRDTTPNLVFAHLLDDRPIRSKLPPTRKQKLTNWNTFRQQEIAPTIKDLEEWTRSLVDATERASTEIETDDMTSPMDPKLAHLIEVRQSLQHQWKRMRHSRTLQKRIAHLGREIEK
ncbi:hypothetical protein MRX96_059075 [Rhipicephalus microplus]